MHSASCSLWEDSRLLWALPTASIVRMVEWKLCKNTDKQKNCAVVGKSPSTKTQTNHNLYVVQSTVERSSIWLEAGFFQWNHIAGLFFLLWMRPNSIQSLYNCNELLCTFIYRSSFALQNTESCFCMCLDCWHVSMSAC